MEKIPPLIQILLALVVLAAAVSDIRTRRIPNAVVVPAVLIGFVLNPVLYGWAGLAHAAGGLGLAALVYVPLYLLRGMGAGDVKLMAAVGALVGWRNWLTIFILTGILGGMIALFLILWKKRLQKTFRNVGYILAEMVRLRPPALKREDLDVASPRAHTLPHGAVIALGCFAFLGAVRFAAG